MSAPLKVWPRQGTGFVPIVDNRRSTWPTAGEILRPGFLHPFPLEQGGSIPSRAGHTFVSLSATLFPKRELCKNDINIPLPHGWSVIYLIQVIFPYNLSKRRQGGGSIHLQSL